MAQNEVSQEEEDSILILGADDVKHELSGARRGVHKLLHCASWNDYDTTTYKAVHLLRGCVVATYNFLERSTNKPYQRPLKYR